MPTREDVENSIKRKMKQSAREEPALVVTPGVLRERYQVGDAKG